MLCKAPSRGAEPVEDAAPVVLSLPMRTAAHHDDAVRADACPRGLSANAVSLPQIGGALREHPAEAVAARVPPERRRVLVEGDGDDFDVVFVVVVEAAERPKLGAATWSPGGEEVEDDGPARGGLLYRDGRSVGERERRVGRAVARARADRDVGAPS